MNTAAQFAAAAVFTLGFCVISPALDGPSDTQAAQDIADDTQLARDTAACRQHRGPDAQIMLLDGMHLVCRPAAQRAHHTATTAQVQP